MDTKQKNEIQAASWEYIPNTDTLLEYLERDDLIELSKCCKRYRNKLECRVLEKLELSIWSRKLDYKYYLEDSEKCEKVPELLKSDLGEKTKFVKELTLICNMSSAFSEKLIKLLPNIKSLTIEQNIDDFLI
ncbi:hypothetical protein CONCODRAFT_10878 [Conidiobolus coronatus NRRL 28638]|uniref:F-box domain-containing protein n=1 Tax=Conidiobolus coronatus (strain ATCC 28846 / CBS 209.66 / NRRL 28638) TaxID=796925 RepID=A0A137NWU2_CONC2|nr:hypothetical protein CONCODRAFT_10878 [Conidiobolus coronatus NRRL 28638]|eukprot:KXN67109.1 hypothetical protein CONCODRAFT_10878 [Conidiobolus coronatus NRRL 28638]